MGLLVLFGIRQLRYDQVVSRENVAVTPQAQGTAIFLLQYAPSAPQERPTTRCRGARGIT